MASVNKVMLIGGVGSAPECKQLAQGMVASFSLGTTEKFNDAQGNKQELTTWHHIKCFAGIAELVSKYVQKGAQLYIEGRLSNRKYTDNNGIERNVTEVIANTIQFLSKKEDGQSQQPAPRQSQQRPQYAPQTPQYVPQQSAPQGGWADPDPNGDLPF